MAKKTNVRKPKNKDHVEIKKLLSTGIKPFDLYNARLKQGKKNPCLRTIQKLNVAVKNVTNSEDYQRLAQPWTLSSTISEIPADVLPIVLQVCMYVNKKGLHLFTAREALWVSRLYAVPRDYYLLKPTKGRWPESYITELSKLSQRYADEATVKQITGGDNFRLDQPAGIFDLYKELMGQTIPQEDVDFILQQQQLLEKSENLRIKKSVETHKFYENVKMEARK